MLKPIPLSVLATAAALGFLAAPDVQAEILDQTLHGFCGTSAATSTCSDNGAITPTNQNPLSSFGFTRSPDSNQNLDDPATFDLVFLIPNNEAVGTLSDTGHHTGIAGPLTETLFPGPAWTSDDLIAYLGLTQTGGPNNPIGAYLPQTQGIGNDPGATGYFVYQANFGAVNFGSGTDPYFTDTNVLPTGTVILAFIECGASAGDSTCPAAGDVQDATANSAALLDTTGKIPPIPEPASLVLLGTALAGLGLFSRRRQS